MQRREKYTWFIIQSEWNHEFFLSLLLQIPWLNQFGWSMAFPGIQLPHTEFERERENSSSISHPFLSTCHGASRVERICIWFFLLSLSLSHLKSQCLHKVKKYKKKVESMWMKNKQKQNWQQPVAWVIILKGRTNFTTSTTPQLNGEITYKLFDSRQCHLSFLSFPSLLQSMVNLLLHQ